MSLHDTLGLAIDAFIGLVLGVLAATVVLWPPPLLEVIR